MACSTLYLEEAPAPAGGRRYDGIRLVLDCDRDDYPHIGVQVAFSDDSQLSCDLTLEQGQHEYTIERGFRRAKHPPRWELIRYIMLTLDGGRHDIDLRYRLQQITLREVPADSAEPPLDGRVPDLFADPILWPRPKEVQWDNGAFAAKAAAILALPRAALQRTRRTAEIFAERYYAYTGRRLERETFDGPTRPIAWSAWSIRIHFVITPCGRIAASTI
jgi:hypothetical protein